MTELKLEGLKELQDALRKLPKDLADEGKEYVDDAVEITAARLFQVYPKGETGNLRAGIRKQVQTTEFGAVGIVRSTAPHAHWWEDGTQSRKTSRGWPRGRVTPHRGLNAIAPQERRRMQQKLIELVKRAGFEVSGSF